MWCFSNVRIFYNLRLKPVLTKTELTQYDVDYLCINLYYALHVKCMHGLYISQVLMGYCCLLCRNNAEKILLTLYCTHISIGQ